MIRKFFYALALVTACLTYSACEMHPPNQVADAEAHAAEKTRIDGQKPQGTNSNAPQFFPDKKVD